MAAAAAAAQHQVMAYLQNPLELERLLLQLTVANTQQIKDAEAIIKKVCKCPESVVALMQQVTGSQHAAVRQLAAVLLRKRLGPLWSKVDAGTKESLKGALLNTLMAEHERSVRKIVAGIIAVAARKLLPKNKWNEIMMFIYQLSQSESEDQRELAFILLSEMAETLGKALKPQFGALKQIYQVALQDKSRKVQVQALNAAAQLMIHMECETDFATFQDLVPGMLAVARTCIQGGDESTVSKVLDVFSDLCQSVSSVINPSVPHITQFSLEVVKNPNLENSTRDVAGMVLCGLAETKPKLLGKRNLVPEMVAVLLEVMAVCQDNAAGALLQSFYEAENEEDEEDFDGPSAQNIAQQCLDTMAINIPAKFFYEPTMSMIGQGLSSPDPNMRKAGAAALGVIIEGCHEQVRKHLREILPRVFDAARDPAVPVRECACFILGQLSEHCQPEIVNYHNEILPLVFNLLDDGTLTVQSTSCHVLETFCENLDKDVMEPYLAPLMQKLVGLLHMPKQSVQEIAIGAISASATGAEEKFLPYVNTIAPLMMQLLPVTDEKLWTLRGRAMDCMARMALAVGKEHFRPYIIPSLQAAGQCLEIGALELKEDAFIFFSNMVRVVGEEFAPHLPALVPQIFQVLEEKDAEVVCVDSDDEDGGGMGKLVEGIDDEDEEESEIDLSRTSSADGGEEDEEDEEEGNFVWDVHTALLDVKKSAVFCLGEFAQHTGPHFAPFLEASMEMLSKQSKSMNHVIRQEAASAMAHLVSSCAAAFPPSREWVKGDLSDGYMSAQTQTLARAAMAVLVPLVQDDVEQEVAAVAFESIQSILELVGPSLLNSSEELERLMLSILMVFQEKSTCQQSIEDDEEDEEGLHAPDFEEDENGHDVMVAASDVCGACAKTLFHVFVPYFDQMVQYLVGFTGPDRPEGQRSMAIGCFAEVCQNLGPHAKRYFDGLLPVVKRALADSCNEVQRNAAFALGVLAEVHGAETGPHVMDLLHSLHPLFTRQETDESGATVDNAAAAVARIIMAAPQSVPLQHVLPTLLQALPLKADMNENESVYKCVWGLLNMNNPDIRSHAGTLLAVFGQVLPSSSGVQDEVKTSAIVPSLRILLQQLPDQTTAAIHSYPPAVQSMLAQCMSGQ